jgi:hypothetical protein
VLTLIWRADGIAEVLPRSIAALAACDPAGSWRGRRTAIRILVRAIKGGRAPTQILPP